MLKLWGEFVWGGLGLNNNPLVAAALTSSCLAGDWEDACRTLELLLQLSLIPFLLRLVSMGHSRSVILEVSM